MSIWFTEEEAGAIRYGYRLEQILHREQSEYQSVEVVETAEYGKMLVIDGFVMTTERDEFVYHEMITHIPLCLHPNPQNVVVIGGGDGGTVREICRYSTVENVTLCEIDRVVVDVSKKYLPDIACRLDDPRVNVRIGDGVGYIAELEKSADVIIIDSTDPIGPGEGLFSGAFYQSVANALKPGGIMVAQSESPWHSQKSLMRIQSNISKGFAHRRPYVGSVPTYPRGLWSWTMASGDPIDPNQLDIARLKTLGPLKYLNPELAKAAFALPEFLKVKLGIE